MDSRYEIFKNINEDEYVVLLFDLCGSGPEYLGCYETLEEAQECING